MLPAFGGVRQANGLAASAQPDLSRGWHRGGPVDSRRDPMEIPQRRPVSLAGLGLISAGAVLGLALAGPAQATPTGVPRPPAKPAVQQPPADDR
jgi:hypothetical protein